MRNKAYSDSELILLQTIKLLEKKQYLKGENQYLKAISPTVSGKSRSQN